MAKREKFCTNCTKNPVKKSGYCFICSKHTVVKTKSGSCFAFSGDFDSNDNPVDGWGLKILPGIRKCGNRDCINKDHIIQDLEFERLNCYTMGVQRSPEEIWFALLREKSGFKGANK